MPDYTLRFFLPMMDVYILNSFVTCVTRNRRGSRLTSGYSLVVGIACSGRILLQSFSLMRLTPLHQSETRPPESRGLVTRSDGMIGEVEGPVLFLPSMLPLNE